MEGNIIKTQCWVFRPLLRGLLLIVCMFEYVKTTSWKILDNFSILFLTNPLLLVIHGQVCEVTWCYRVLQVEGKFRCKSKEWLCGCRCGTQTVPDARKAPGSWIPKDIHKNPLQNSSTSPHFLDPLIGSNSVSFDALIRFINCQQPLVQAFWAFTMGLLFLGCLIPMITYCANIVAHKCVKPEERQDSHG